MKLSIIIPVYNTSKYLRKCLDSCVNQDIPSSDYEVIVVNDGSKDDSLLIINEYIRANNNLYYILVKDAEAEEVLNFVRK